MESFIRQEALELLLRNHPKINPDKLKQALQKGLADPDLEIAEKAWKFIKEKQLGKNFKKELIDLAMRAQASHEPYYTKVANQILTVIENLSVPQSQNRKLKV